VTELGTIPSPTSQGSLRDQVRGVAVRSPWVQVLEMISSPSSRRPLRVQVLENHTASPVLGNNYESRYLVTLPRSSELAPNIKIEKEFLKCSRSKNPLNEAAFVFVGHGQATQTQTRPDHGLTIIIIDNRIVGV